MIFHVAAEVFLDQEVEHDVTKRRLFSFVMPRMQHACSFRKSCINVHKYNFLPSYEQVLSETAILVMCPSLSLPLVCFLQDVLGHAIDIFGTNSYQDYLWVAREYFNY
jgi:hypothetical protein